MDDHNPKGLESKSDMMPPSFLYPAPSPFGIPYRSLYSKNIKNLFMAGRNISATHAAMSSTRVMATCALVGQAVGAAAAIATKNELSPRGVYEQKREELKADLRDSGCYIPFSVREIPALTLSAKTNLTDDQRSILQNGIERPDENFTKNYIELPIGETISFSFEKPEYVESLRIIFDLDFSRESVSVNKKMRVFAQKCNEGADFKPMKVAKTLVKAFSVYADDELIYSTDSYHNSRFTLHVGRELSTLSVRFDETWGEETVHLFSCDVR